MVSMVSNRVDDENWVFAVFQWLGERAYSLDEHGSTTSHNIHKKGKICKGLLSNGQYVAALVGYCENKDECFLVYELCHHGNLSEWLYLQGDSGFSILIRKAASFIVISRCIRVQRNRQSHVSSEVKGTFGYVDLEYNRNHRVNAPGDVYSFGILLLQLLSGQRVLNMNLHTPLPLSKMARKLTKDGDISKFADPELNGEYSLEVFDIVLKLALSCIGIHQERPSVEQDLMSYYYKNRLITSPNFHIILYNKMHSPGPRCFESILILSLFQNKLSFYIYIIIH
ncbi:putative Plant U-box 18 [Hibiscus syriacus]|uniref:Plant U-box 18 n=1 Tax=Hibiscus syriacus TaxID=106335 RepID=A0A6A2Z9E3_HIBSY|nr:putative Plant U-box 18 [Hibiscus syriacus]